MNQGLLDVIARLENRTGPRRATESWRTAAKCRGTDPDVFYPPGRSRLAYEETEVAKAICQGCPSREPCLRYALATREDLGVWGGTSPQDRRRILRTERGAVAS